MADLAKDEVRIRVKSCGICGTDQHIYHGHPGSAEVTPPIVLGHELSGEVTEVGSAAAGIRVGDRVSVDPNMYCGHCEYCRDGRPQLCDRLQAVGVTRDGGMAEYCVVPAANVYVMPDGMTWDEGALVEPLGCVLQGIKKLDIQADYSVLIIGGGFIGQLFLQLFKASGCSSITMSEPLAEKHARLRGLGADVVISPLDAGMDERLTNGYDLVVECVGRKESMESAVSAAKKGGQVLLFGVASPDTRIGLSPYAIFSKELKIMGSFINPYRHSEAMALIEQGVVKVEPLISHCFQLDELPEVMARYPSLKVSKGIIALDDAEQEMDHDN